MNNDDRWMLEANAGEMTCPLAHPDGPTQCKGAECPVWRDADIAGKWMLDKVGGTYRLPSEEFPPAVRVVEVAMQGKFSELVGRWPFRKQVYETKRVRRRVFIYDGPIGRCGLAPGSPYPSWRYAPPDLIEPSDA